VVNAEQSCCFAIASSSNQKIPANNPAFPENAAPSQRRFTARHLKASLFVAAEYALYMVPRSWIRLGNASRKGVRAGFFGR